MTTTLSVYDLTMLRFGAAGVLLFPVVLRKGLALERLGPLRLARARLQRRRALCARRRERARLAPVAHAGALLPGSMPCSSRCSPGLLTRERFTASRASSAMR